MYKRSVSTLNMKVIIFVALFIASGYALVPEKFIPSFATGRIIKGHEANRHAAPYIVSLSKNAKKHAHMCGGTLLDKSWVLTAGHCISKPIGMGVAAGLHERANFDEDVQTREVDFGKVHELFAGNVGPYDIAILHVSKPFEFNIFVQSAALPFYQEVHSGEMHLYGWGQPKAYVLTASKSLQTVETEIVEWKKCKSILPPNAPLYESNLCSDSMDKGISACNGDSGGPLVLEKAGTSSELVGIVSWGYIPCGYANKPSIYTRVSDYIPWIHKIQNAYNTIYG